MHSQGYTVNYPFQFHPKAPRVFNGKILYEVLPTSSSTDAPTAGPDIPSGKNNALSTDLALSDSVSSFLTTFVSNNGHSGNLFTIEAKEVDIIVETFAVHTASTNDNLKLKIYTKFGNFSRQDGDPSIAWTEIADTTVEGLGEFQPTHVPSKDVQSILMKANTRQSFYITFTGPYIKYTSALIDPNIIQNDHLRFLASAGTQFPFHYYFPNRIWNGVVYYKVGDDGSADLQGSDTAIEDGDSSQGEGPSNVADNPIWSSASVAPRSSP